MIMNPTAFEGEFPTDAAGLEGVGSGAYRLVEWRPNEGETFEKVDTYWDADVVANAPRSIEMVFAPDVNTKLNALRTGEWTSFNISGAEEQVQELAASDDGVAVLAREGGIAGVFLGVESPPFDQLEARQAVAHAIDVETLTSTLLAASCGVVANLPMTPPDHWSIPGGSERTYPYDPDRARELVDGLGGLSFTMDFSPGTGGEPIANALQAQFAEVGMDVAIEGVPGGQSVPAFLRGEFPALTNFLVGQPDPHLVVNQFFTGGYSVSRDPAVAEAAAAANDSTLSQDERAARYAELWPLINEEASFVPICYTSGGFAFRSDIDFSNNPYNNSGVDWSAVRVAAE
jgi:peptide/nickel transport system substrate-binding protein